MLLFISSLLALFAGAALGIVGGGGSILLLPILIYVLGQEPAAAIPLSLLVVGATSAAALIPHARSGNVEWRRGALFGASGMLGAYLGGRLSGALPPWLLMSAFALLMLGTAASMLLGRRAVGRPADARLARALLQGASVGVVSGLLGAGGGFLVVPTLVLFGGLTMRRAVGTSLLVIAMQSAAGLAAHLHQATLDWKLAAWIVPAAIIGSWLGARWSLRLPQVKLRRWFGWLVLVLGTFVLVQQLPLAVLRHALLSPVAPLAGGLLIGSAAALLWLVQGRVAGISGIAGGLLSARRGDRSWRWLFVLGLVVGGALMARLAPGAFGASPVSIELVALSGLLVGIGTTLANGCTSGHGVCGLSRLSSRSIAATVSFMGAGVLAAYFAQHVFGGNG